MFSFLFSDQYRNHRKVLLVDGAEALTGGRNIADEYFDLRSDFNFIDRDILVQGEIVSAIQKTFDKMWESKLSVKVKRADKPKIDDVFYNPEDGIHDHVRFKDDLERFDQKVKEAVEFLSVSDEKFLNEIRTKGKEQLAKEYRGTCDNMSFNSEYPIIGKKNRSMRIIKHTISERIKNAKESILFDSPYFIVDSESSEALDEALKDKVKIRLLTNSLYSTDAIYVYDTFDTIIKRWIKKGLDPYIFKGDLPESYTVINNDISDARFGIHAKTFVFDNKDVVIGTYNFDPRSSNYNTEMTVSCDNNPEFAKVVTEDIEERIKGSILLDSSKDVDAYQFYDVSFIKRIGYLILKIPSNLFKYLL
jgi:putative cardiolipin synthase